MLLGRISGIGLSFVANMVLARRLSPEDFGLFVLVISIIAFGTILARFGLDRTLVRFISESVSVGDKARVARTLWIATRLVVGSAVLVSLLCALFLNLFGSSLLGLPKPETLLVTAAMGLILLTLLQLFAESFRGFHELRFSSLFDAQNSGPLINVVFLFLLLVVDRGQQLSLPRSLLCYVGALAAVLPFSLFFLGRTVSHYFVKSRPEPVTESLPKELRSTELVGVCLPIMVSQVIGFIVFQADVWIAGVCCVGEDVALLASGRRLMQTVALPLAMVNMTVLSTIPELYIQGRIRELQRVLRATAAVAAVPSLVVLLAMAVFAEQVLAVAFGPFYRNASTILIVLCFGQLVRSWTGTCGNSLMLTGYHRTVLVVDSIAATVLVLCGGIAASVYGITGLAIVSSLVTAGENLALWFVARRCLGVWTHASFDVQLTLQGSRGWPGKTAYLPVTVCIRSVINPRTAISGSYDGRPRPSIAA